jgi:hypothetical protein
MFILKPHPDSLIRTGSCRRARRDAAVGAGMTSSTEEHLVLVHVGDFFSSSITALIRSPGGLRVLTHTVPPRGRDGTETVSSTGTCTILMGATKEILLKIHYFHVVRG